MSFSDDFMPKLAQSGAHSKRLMFAFLGAFMMTGMLGSVIWMANPMQKGVMFALPFLLMSLISLWHGIYHLNEFHARFGSQDTEKSKATPGTPPKRKKNNRRKNRR